MKTNSKRGDSWWDVDLAKKATIPAALSAMNKQKLLSLFLDEISLVF